jgi:ribose-phosphate pyrophosphokinase
MILTLNPGFQPFPQQQQIPFESFQFSGGEPHIKIGAFVPDDQPVAVSHRLNSFNDLGLLCLAVDALKRMGVSKIEILIPYFPAARQDRVMIKGEPLSVKVYADIINALGVNRVTVFDPHSEVTPALLNNCEVVPNYYFIKKVVKSLPSTVLLISPDGGALKKIYKVSQHLGNAEVIECSKSRDVNTGHISGFKVNSDNLEGKTCLIVDDICDGGQTFIGLAAELKKKNAGKIYLAVSHGIFSKEFNELSKHLDGIFTTDSFREIKHPLVTQFKLQDGLLSE